MLVTDDLFEDALRWLGSESILAIDTETTGLDPYKAKHRICGISFTDPDGVSAYFPFRHAVGQNLSLSKLQAVIDLLNARMIAGDLDLLFWNAKFDLHMLAADGFEPPRVGHIFDFMIGAHLLNENEPSYGLKEFADRYGIGEGSLDENALRLIVEQELGIRTTDKTWKGYIHKLPACAVADYAESDTELTYAAAAMIHPALVQWRLLDLFVEYSDYLLLIWRMERLGVQIDTAKIRDQMKRLAPAKLQTLDDILKTVQEWTGSTLDPTPREVKLGKRGAPLKQKPTLQFNPASVPQLIYLTNWFRTDVRYLEELADDDPTKAFGELVLDYRVLSKMSGTYYDAYLDLVDEFETLRPNYNIHGTVSGRASCSRPNLQNVPRYTERRPVKDVFVPREGMVFIECDYQQAELRIASHYAGETNMQQIFADGRDPHTETASSLGIPRFVGKTLNFAVIYGAGVRAVVKTLKCDQATAKRYLTGYHNLYPRFRLLSDAMQAQAQQQGYIRLQSGRVRHFDTWKINAWEADPHKAMNSLIQGTASEMLRVGMQRVDQRFFEDDVPAHILLQVHDSLLIESSPDAVYRVLEILEDELTAFDFDPAPAIDAKIGKTWAQMEGVA